MVEIRKFFSVLILAAAASIVFHSASRATTVAFISATGAPNQEIFLTSGVPFGPFSIGNWGIAGLLVDVFRDQGIGHSVQGSIASFVPAGSGSQFLQIYVSTNNLLVPDDISGTGTPPGTPIQLNATGTASAGYTIDEHFTGT